MAKPEPLLDLSALIERPKVNIDGKPHEILSPDELSVLDSARFERWGREIERLSKVTDDDDEADEALTRLDELVETVARKIMVGVPDAVYAQLAGVQKMQVVAAFTGLLMAKSLGATGALVNALKRSGLAVGLADAMQKSAATGAKSSPPSSASTAETPDGGSTAPRPR